MNSMLVLSYGSQLSPQREKSTYKQLALGETLPFWACFCIDWYRL